jgi:hypothetical protein
MKFSTAAGALIAGAAIVALALPVALPAVAGEPSSGCRVRGFTVNDFGKDGPSRDAQSLLDKDIASWAKENGIGKYKTGPKTVTCVLYLDVGLFDEYTCTAKARVCW